MGRADADGFVFAVKASRYLTHIKRLTDMSGASQRLLERLEPLHSVAQDGADAVAAPRELPPRRRAPGLRPRPLPPGRHAFEFRHPSWFADEVLELLRDHDVALTIGDHPERPLQSHELTADFTFVRLHHGAPRAARQLRPPSSRPGRGDRACARRADVFAYFNNDWEGFAVQQRDRAARPPEQMSTPGPPLVRPALRG